METGVTAGQLWGAVGAFGGFITLLFALTLYAVKKSISTGYEALKQSVHVDMSEMKAEFNKTFATKVDLEVRSGEGRQGRADLWDKTNSVRERVAALEARINGRSS